MIIQEFEKLTGFHPATDLYKAIEHAYIEFDGDKVEFSRPTSRTVTTLPEGGKT